MAYEDYPSQSGARLTTAERKRMPTSSFALPGKGAGPSGKGAGSYPIPDLGHARNALARVSQHGSSAEKSRVRSAVHRKFPGIKQQAGARGWRQVGDASDAGWQPNLQLAGAGANMIAGRPAMAGPGQGGTMFGQPGQGQQQSPQYQQLLNLISQGGLGPPQGVQRLPQSGARAGWNAKDYPGEKIRGRAGKGVGARGHADEAEDRALIKRMMAAHDRGKGKDEDDGTQFGARMAPLGRDHALAMASATHLHRMGHINKQQLKAIHAHAKNALAAGRGMPALGGAPPGPMAGPAPPAMPAGNAPMGGMGPPGGMSFGSLAPPDLG
jgi:hypothetical protein